MNPTSAGIMAQVIAVLVLAVAFAPAIRGELPKAKTLYVGGRTYREIEYTRFHIWYRIIMTGLSLVILATNVVILVSGIETDDFMARVGFALMNASAVGFLGATIMGDMIKHARSRSTKNDSGDTDEQYS